MGFWQRLLRTFQPEDSEHRVQELLEQISQDLPTPCLALLGEPQVGKSSVVRLLTGDPTARIGLGDGKPVTQNVEAHQFPRDAAVPLWTFLDMPGLGVRPPDLDRQELEVLLEGEARTADSAAPLPIPHAFVLCVRVDDEELGILPWLTHLYEHLPQRGQELPVLAVQTCLHRILHPHPTPYPFGPCGDELPDTLPADVRDRLQQQRDALREVIPDPSFVVVDITDPEDEVGDPQYGGAALLETLFARLPDTIAATLREQRQVFDEAFAQEADRLIWSYAVTAGSAGALPPPMGDLGTLAITTSMLRQLATLYRQKWDWQQLIELLSGLGGTTLLWLLLRYLGRRIPIPVLMAPLGAAGAFTLTFSVGHLMAWYYAHMRHGHIPTAEDIKQRWKEAEAESVRRWKDVAQSLLKKTPSSDTKQTPSSDTKV